MSQLQCLFDRCGSCGQLMYISDTEQVYCQCPEFRYVSARKPQSPQPPDQELRLLDRISEMEMLMDS